MFHRLGGADEELVAVVAQAAPELVGGFGGDEFTADLVEGRAHGSRGAGQPAASSMPSHQALADSGKGWPPHSLTRRMAAACSASTRSVSVAGGRGSTP